jgi:hypothetical protein
VKNEIANSAGRHAMEGADMDIYTVPDFLPVEDCRAIIAIFRQGVTEGRLQPQGTERMVLNLRLANVLERDGGLFGKLRDLRLDVGHRLADFYGVDPVFPDYTVYTALYLSGSHELHADGFKLDGTPNHAPWRVLSAMLYLNDGGSVAAGDFDGGELTFPRLNRRVEPPGRAARRLHLRR